jgi:hypothetical protein
MTEEVQGTDAPIEALEQATTPETVETPTEDTANPTEETKQAEKTFTQAELDAIIQKEKAKAESKAERRALKAYQETLERFAPPQQNQSQPQASDRPTQAQFANVDDYVEAMTDWKLGKLSQDNQAKQQAQQHQTITQKTESIYAEAEKIAGFDREAFDELPITKSIAEALIDSEAPAKLMAHLANHPEEVDRITQLSPARQAAEIGKLEDRLATAPKVSKAPAPIQPIGARGSATNNDLGKMSMDEYYAKRKADGAGWARR